MLSNLSDEIRRCYERAHECGRKAQAAFNEESRQDFLTLERNWPALAQSYEFTARLADFNNETKRQRDRWLRLGAGSSGNIVPFLVGQAFAPETVRQLSKAFDRVCAVLKVTSPSEAEKVAQKIIDLAQRGLRDDAQIARMVIEEFGS